jgi:cytidyltransferase-like protein
MIIGVTSGCFDILHPLHIIYLNKCRKECDRLYVFIDSDELIYKRKGELPVFNERDRAFMLKQLEQVYDVYIMNSKEDFEATAQLFGATKMFKHKIRIDRAPTWSFTNMQTVIIRDVNNFSSSTEIKNFLKS